MSATALAEYLILRPDQQETVLHDSRFSRPPIVNAYGDAMRGLRAYNRDIGRSQQILDDAKRALSVKTNSPTARPSARDEARRCIEAIELFERAENAFAMRQLSLIEAPRFSEIDVSGVALSVQPDLLIHGGGSGSRQRVGAMSFRLAKAPDPLGCKLDETRKSRGDHRREMARYMVAMLDMLLEAQAVEQFGKPDRSLCFVADIRLGERIGAAPDHAARLRAIRAACDQIARLWSTVRPRPSILAP